MDQDKVGEQESLIEKPVLGKHCIPEILLNILQRNKTEKNEKLLMVDRQFAHCILDNIKRLPKFEITKYTHLILLGLKLKISNKDPEGNSIALEEIPKDSYFRSLSVTITWYQGMYDDLQDYVAMNGQLIAYDYRVTNYNSRIDIVLAYCNRFVITTNEFIFDNNFNCHGRGPTIHPIHMYSTIANQVQTRFDFCQISPGNNDSIMINDYIFDNGSPINNRIFLRLRFIRASWDFQLFMQLLYERFQTVNPMEKIVKNVELKLIYVHEVVGPYESLNGYAATPMDESLHISRIIKQDAPEKRDTYMFATARKDGWKIMVILEEIELENGSKKLNRIGLQFVPPEITQ